MLLFSYFIPFSILPSSIPLYSPWAFWQNLPGWSFSVPAPEAPLPTCSPAIQNSILPDNSVWSAADRSTPGYNPAKDVMCSDPAKTDLPSASCFSSYGISKIRPRPASPHHCSCLLPPSRRFPEKKSAYYPGTVKIWLFTWIPPGAGRSSSSRLPAWQIFRQ